VARVFVTRKLPGAAVDRLAAEHDLTVWPERLPPPAATCGRGQANPKAS